MMNSSKSKLVFFSLIFCIPLLFLSCNGEDEFKFPYKSIDITLHIPTDFAEVGFYDAKIIENEGIGGLLIFRISDFEFMAFDRACTYEVPTVCVIEEYENAQIIWECSCCKSQYTFNNYGCYVSQGPARWALKKYPVQVDGDFLTIRY